ncbi:MarR family transcriptional regulator [Xylanimonas allomyrinae]|uniref:MarR family transcriptional regulator n=1 Tax=Xylanimonas allomyrinae TaxID=2509459 RepID=A0A4P6F3H6_9MICO|nr:MarR family transcriptional regulator [Xylanimonas allomyrinae]
MAHAAATSAAPQHRSQPPAEDLFSALEELARAQREAGLHLARRLDWPRAGLGVVRLLSTCGPVQLTDVAAKLRVDVSVASRQVSQLVDAGYVRRTVDAADRRVRVLELTEQGEALTEQLAVQFAEMLGGAFTLWSPAEIAQASHQVRRVAQAITSAHDAPLDAALEPPLTATDEEGTH